MNTPDQFDDSPSFETFKAAFCKLMKCSPDAVSFVDKMGYELVNAEYNGQKYAIATSWSIKMDIRHIIAYEHSAARINLFCWKTATRDIVSIKNILPPLIAQIKKKRQASLLNLALSIIQHSINPYDDFWNILSRIDHKDDLLGKAIVSVYNNYDQDDILTKMTRETIKYGLRTLNEVENGIFQAVTVKQPGEPETVLFIYTVSDFLEE